MEQTNNQSQTLYPMKQDMTVPPGMGAPVAPNVPGITGMAEGGLMDEGGSVDPVSGNEVPAGSLKEEVRDDIPAKLSEGEFVFPADVVRFIGLDRLMKMRQLAKDGLAKMEAMGQMGNADEATMEDDGDFESNIDELLEEIDNEQKMAEGGLPPPVMQQDMPQDMPATNVDAQVPPPAETDNMLAENKKMKPSDIISEYLARDGVTESDEKELDLVFQNVAKNRAFVAQENNTIFVGSATTPGTIVLKSYTVDTPEIYSDAVGKFYTTLVRAKVASVDTEKSSPELLEALRVHNTENLLKLS